MMQVGKHSSRCVLSFLFFSFQSLSILKSFFQAFFKLLFFKELVAVKYVASAVFLQDWCDPGGSLDRQIGARPAVAIAMQAGSHEAITVVTGDWVESRGGF